MKTKFDRNKKRNVEGMENQFGTEIRTEVNMLSVENFSSQDDGITTPNEIRDRDS